MRALIIREPWIDLIKQGLKTWELRPRATQRRGQIALIRQGSGQVEAVANLVECRSTLTRMGLETTWHYHRVPPEKMDEVATRGWLVPWVLSDVRVLSAPVSYEHPTGAVTWVRLDPNVIQRIVARTPTIPSEYLSPEPPESPNTPAAARQPAAPQFSPQNDALGKKAGSKGSVTIIVTEGNIRNGHIYLRKARHLIPDTAIGGSNKSNTAKDRIRVIFDTGDTVESDIAGDKMILRDRKSMRRFLHNAGIKPGDAISIRSDVLGVLYIGRVTAVD